MIRCAPLASNGPNHLGLCALQVEFGCYLGPLVADLGAPLWIGTTGLAGLGLARSPLADTLVRYTAPVPSLHTKLFYALEVAGQACPAAAAERAGFKELQQVLRWTLQLQPMRRIRAVTV